MVGEFVVVCSVGKIIFGLSALGTLPRKITLALFFFFFFFFFFFGGGGALDFLRVKKMPILRAGGRGNLDNAQKKGRFFWEVLP